MRPAGVVKGVALAGVVIGLAWFVTLREPGRKDAAVREDASAPVPGKAAEGAGSNGDRPSPVGTAPFVGGDDRPRLLVVDAAGGHAVPGADVWLLEESALDEGARYRIQALALDGFARAEEYGRRFVSDARGSVDLPPSGARIVAAGRKVGRSGCLEIEPDTPPPWKLELAMIPSLRIQTIDGGSHPVSGVPVILAGVWRGRHRRLWTGLTREPDGIAATASIDVVREKLAPDEFLAAMPGFPLADPPIVRIGPGPPPGEPVRLTLPPTGRVRVQVTDGNGRPFAGPALANLGLRAEVDRDSSSYLGSLPARPEPAVRGEAVFHRVGVGLDLRVEVRSADPALRPAVAEGPGPLTAGEETVFDVAVRRRWPVLTGNARVEGGAALKRRNLAWTIEQTGPGGPAWGALDGVAATDEAGRFEILLNLDPATEARWRVRLVLLAEDGSGDRTNGPRAWIGVPFPVPEGNVDAGTVTLVEEPLIASGTVVDDAGAPVPGAIVRVERQTRVDARGPARDGVAGLPLSWSAQDKIIAETDANGAFTIRGACGPGPLRLFASHAAFFEDEHVRFEPGTTGLRLTLLRGGAIEGSVLLPPGAPAWSFRMEVKGVPAASLDLAHPEGEARSGAQAQARLDAEGGFRWTGLIPGTATVDVLADAWGSITPLVTFGDVVVRAGETTRDPRLQGIDLRSRFHAITITVQDEAGRAPRMAEVAMPLPDPGAGVKLFMADAFGRAVVITERLPVDLTIGARGYVPQRFTGVASDRKVVLVRGPDVRLVFAGGFQLPEHPLWLEAAVSAVDSGGRRERTGDLMRYDPHSARVASDRRATLRFSRPGRYQVSLHLRRESWKPGAPLELTQVIQVEDKPGEQSFEFAIAQEMIDRARTALGP